MWGVGGSAVSVGVLLAMLELAAEAVLYLAKGIYLLVNKLVSIVNLTIFTRAWSP
jgi:hypothetical protein